MSAPVGATGIVACSGTSHAGAKDGSAPAPTTFHASLSAGYSYSDLIFFDGDEIGFEKASLMYGSDFVLSKRVLFSIAAGGVFNGHLRLPTKLGRGRDRSLAPGWIASAAATFRVVDDEGAVPYVLLTASAGAMRSATRERPTEDVGVRGAYTGVDLRFGVTIGKTFADVVSPYIAARLFGGPVIWSEGGDDRLGSDLYHFQPAFGLSLILPEKLDLFAEGQPWFERGFVVGVGLRN